MFFPKGAQRSEAGTPSHFFSQSATLLNSGCIMPLLQAGFQPGSSFFFFFWSAYWLLWNWLNLSRFSWDGRAGLIGQVQINFHMFIHPHRRNEKCWLLVHVSQKRVVEGQPPQCFLETGITDGQGPCVCKPVLTWAVSLIQEPLGILGREHLFCAFQSMVQDFIKAYPKIKFLLQLPTSAARR